MIDAPLPRRGKDRGDEARGRDGARGADSPPADPPPAGAPPADARRRRRVRMPDASPTGLDDAGSTKREERAPASPAVASHGGPAASAQTAPVHDEEPATWPAIDGDVVAVERGLRSIVGGGSSQVTPGAALRARDAARPRPADVERAEAELTIIRRHWTPRD